MYTMKKIIFSCLLLTTTFIASAQSEKYLKAMQTNVSAIDSAFSNPSNLLSLSNSFERIALAEKNQWLPYYYAAFLQVNYGFTKGDLTNADPIADKAEMLINTADSLMPKNSEISCIKAMIATLKMLVDPMNRYMSYGLDIQNNLEKAKTLDPSNPRPYYLEGQNLKNTPPQFGGGCDAAKPKFEIAKQKFLTFKPQSNIDPNWGSIIIDQLLSECK